MNGGRRRRSAATILTAALLTATACSGGHATHTLAAGTTTTASATTVVTSTSASPSTALATVPPATTGPTAPPPTGPPTTTRPADCHHSDLRATLTLDRTSGPPGTPVTMTFTFTNVAGFACTMFFGRGYSRTPVFYVAPAAPGNDRWGWDTAMCGPGPTIVHADVTELWAAGHQETSTATWDATVHYGPGGEPTAQSCSTDPYPPGAYRATAAFHGTVHTNFDEMVISDPVAYTVDPVVTTAPPSTSTTSTTP